MDRLNNWAIAAVAAIYAAGVGALTATIWKAWLALGLTCVAAGALGFTAYLMIRRRPRVFVGEAHYDSTTVPVVEVEEKDPVRVQTLIGRERVLITYLRVWNNPKAGHSDLNGTYAILRFHDPVSGAALSQPLFARWSHLSQDVPIEATTVPRPITLLAEDDLHYARIDIVFLSENGLLYAINDASRYLLHGHLDESRRLGSGPVLLDVNVRGRAGSLRVDRHFGFIIRAEGRPASMFVEPLAIGRGRRRSSRTPSRTTIAV